MKQSKPADDDDNIEERRQLGCAVLVGVDRCGISIDCYYYSVCFACQINPWNMSQLLK